MEVERGGFASPLYFLWCPGFGHQLLRFRLGTRYHAWPRHRGPAHRERGSDRSRGGRSSPEGRVL